MSRVTRVIVILVAIVVVGGAAALAMWDIPAPSTKVEKVIPDARFQR
jgi:hypothetical protein